MPAERRALAGQPKWFTPARLLLIFCTTNLVVYLDRGLISSNGVNGSPRSEAEPEGSGIQGEFDLTLFKDGLLPAAFMIGLLLSSPVFAEVCKQYSAFRLLGIGMGVWSCACVLCGLAPNFATLMLARVFVGVGEASFVALAAPFIDDYAPEKSKSKWFAMFYLCIPVGFAVGYIVGGLVAPAMGWRAAFFIEGSVMVPFVIFCLQAQPLQLHGTTSQKQLGGAGGAEAEEDGVRAGSSAAVPGHHGHGASKHGIWHKLRHHASVFCLDVRVVLRQRVWVLACVAYTLYVAVLGVYAYWGPKAGKALFFANDAGGQQADLVFGGVTVLTGVVGSIMGGVLLDKLGNSLRLAALICALATLSGTVALLPGFLATQSFATFMAAFAVGQLLIFLLQAPVVAVQMWSVPQPLRALGASLMTVSIHLLGDVPSPPLLGLLQSRLSEGKDEHDAAEMWRVSMSLVTLLLVLSGLFFFLASRAAVPSADFRAHHVVVGTAEGTAPLLQGGEDEDGNARATPSADDHDPEHAFLPAGGGGAS